MSLQIIGQRFKDLTPSPEWAFANVGRSETNYVTHGYHRYPAKFIPNLVERLIKDYTKPGNIVVDPFGGCGTTLVEAKISGRESFGFDINPVAKLISQAKITPISPITLESSYKKFENHIQRDYKFPKFLDNERLNYWFDHSTLEGLNRIYASIKLLKDPEVKKLYLCTFSHILKNCSRWLMKSTKPQVDPNKKPAIPRDIFFKHLRFVTKRNNQFFELLKNKGFLEVPSRMKIANSTKRLPLKDNTVDLIITSPPYVTSYEYADLHQLSLLWFGNDKNYFKKWNRHIKDFNGFRKKFIGTSIRKSRRKELPNSFLGKKIIEDVSRLDVGTARGISHYFSDMNKSFTEMFRILKPNGKACIIIGNTSLRGVEILNAEVATEQMHSIGFKEVNFIKRVVSNKMITPWRDQKSGKFTGKNNPHKTRAYEYEYVIVVEKLSQ